MQKTAAQDKTQQPGELEQCPGSDTCFVLLEQNTVPWQGSSGTGGEDPEKTWPCTAKDFERFKLSDFCSVLCIFCSKDTKTVAKYRKRRCSQQREVTHLSANY